MLNTGNQSSLTHLEALWAVTHLISYFSDKIQGHLTVWSLCREWHWITWHRQHDKCSVFSPWLYSKWGLVLGYSTRCWEESSLAPEEGGGKTTDLGLSLKSWRIPDLQYCRWPNSRFCDCYCWHTENWRRKFLVVWEISDIFHNKYSNKSAALLPLSFNIKAFIRQWVRGLSHSQS